MTVLNDTNHGRVAKIVEILSLLQKSADSNKASQEDLWNLFTPVVDALQGLLDPEMQPASDSQTDEPKTGTEAAPIEGALTLRRARQALARYGNGFLNPDDLIFRDLARELPLPVAYLGLEILIQRFADEVEKKKP